MCRLSLYRPPLARSFLQVANKHLLLLLYSVIVDGKRVIVGTTNGEIHIFEYKVSAAKWREPGVFTLV